MNPENESGHQRASLLREVRYSLRQLLKEVKQEREGSTIGQEIVDQSEISKLFTSKKRSRRGQS